MSNTTLLTVFQMLKLRMLYIVLSKRLNPASNICDSSWLEIKKKKKEKGWGRDCELVLPSWRPGRRAGASVHRAVADPAAQHHAEDHFKDLAGRTHKVLVWHGNMHLTHFIRSHQVIFYLPMKTANQTFFYIRDVWQLHAMINSLIFWRDLL